jgi:hypothetical protein
MKTLARSGCGGETIFSFSSENKTGVSRAG